MLTLGFGINSPIQDVAVQWSFWCVELSFLPQNTTRMLTGCCWHTAGAGRDDAIDGLMARARSHTTRIPEQ
jgi:hypothetical protein